MIMFKCPECTSKDITQIMCCVCYGAGLDKEDSKMDCHACYGYGYMIHEFECFNCGHTFPQKDLL